ncbi:MAG: hypothetical protein HC919_10285 [Oscillatoriales cyanobacterium SM2_2_1]|nr:hypothetical protein [Oscillatoriales cyanobacterium SM2_2_1]
MTSDASQLHEELRVIFEQDTERNIQIFIQTLAQWQAETWSQDIYRLYRCVHTIKGGAGTVGIAETQGVAKAAEDLLGDLRYLETAPDLTDGRLHQILSEVIGMVIISLQEGGQDGEGAIARIHQLQQQVQRAYLPDWSELRKLHHEFADQGFGLITLDLEMGVEALPAYGDVPVNLVVVAKEVMEQLESLGLDMDLESGWRSLLSDHEIFFVHSKSHYWREHWTPYLGSLQACIKLSGKLPPHPYQPPITYEEPAPPLALRDAPEVGNAHLFGDLDDTEISVIEHETESSLDVDTLIDLLDTSQSKPPSSIPELVLEELTGDTEQPYFNIDEISILRQEEQPVAPTLVIPPSFEYLEIPKPAPLEEEVLDLPRFDFTEQESVIVEISEQFSFEEIMPSLPPDLTEIYAADDDSDLDRFVTQSINDPVTDIDQIDRDDELEDFEAVMPPITSQGDLALLEDIDSAGDDHDIEVTASTSPSQDFGGLDDSDMSPEDELPHGAMTLPEDLALLEDFDDFTGFVDRRSDHTSVTFVFGEIEENGEAIDLALDSPAVSGAGQEEILEPQDESTARLDAEPDVMEVSETTSSQSHFPGEPQSEFNSPSAIPLEVDGVVDELMRQESLAIAPQEQESSLTSIDHGGDDPDLDGELTSFFTFTEEDAEGGTETVVDSIFVEVMPPEATLNDLASQSLHPSDDLDDDLNGDLTGFFMDDLTSDQDAALVDLDAVAAADTVADPGPSYGAGSEAEDLGDFTGFLNVANESEPFVVEFAFEEEVEDDRGDLTSFFAVDMEESPAVEFSFDEGFEEESSDLTGFFTSREDENPNAKFVLAEATAGAVLPDDGEPIDPEFLELFQLDTQRDIQSYVHTIDALSAETWKADIQQLYRAVHTIKGGAVTVRAESIRLIANAIEDMLSDLRYSETAPPLEDGNLQQILTEAGELLIGGLEMSPLVIPQSTLQRIHQLHQQVKETYLSEWNEQRQLWQEFAVQGFDLVVLDWELAVEQLPATGDVPEEAIAIAQATLQQLRELAQEMNFLSDWEQHLSQTDLLFAHPNSPHWRTHVPPYLKFLKEAAKQGGRAPKPKYQITPPPTTSSARRTRRGDRR